MAINFGINFNLSVKEFNLKKVLEKEIKASEIDFLIQDKPRKQALSKKDGYIQKSNMTVRKLSRKLDKTTNYELGEKFNKQYEIFNYFTKNKGAQQMLSSLAKTNAIFNIAPNQIKRTNNSLQSLVRTPIFKKEYGSNTSYTIKAKGFDYKMVDTGQFFNSIKVEFNKRK